MLSLKVPNSRLTKWQLRLEEFDFEIKYKKGKDNTVADALSRIEVDTKETRVDDDDLDLVSILPDVDDNEELLPDDADEILNNSPKTDSNT